MNYLTFDPVRQIAKKKDTGEVKDDRQVEGVIFVPFTAEGKLHCSRVAFKTKTTS